MRTTVDPVNSRERSCKSSAPLRHSSSRLSTSETTTGTSAERTTLLNEVSRMHRGWFMGQIRALHVRQRTFCVNARQKQYSRRGTLGSQTRSCQYVFHVVA